MNALAPIEAVSALAPLIDRAALALTNSRSAAEVLDAKDAADFAYDAAKRAARLSKAKGAHDEVTAAALRAQADANEIIAAAQRRLADEYDAAQQRGEVAGHGGGRNFKVAEPDLEKPTIADLGLSKQQISDARIMRDAEKNDPGITRRVLDEKLAKGEEPTKAALRQEVMAAAKRGLTSPSRPAVNGNKNPHYAGPDPQWDAMLAVSDGCRTILAKAGTLAPRYLLGGFRVEGQRDRNLATIRECRDFLTTILETADAQ